MTENIPNEDLTLDHVSGSPISGGAFVVVPPSLPSPFNKALNKDVYKTPLSFSFSGGTSTTPPLTAIQSLPPIQTIPTSATKCKAEGVLVMLEGDSVTMTAQGIDGGGNPVAISGDVEIKLAGQDKGKGI